MRARTFMSSVAGLMLLFAGAAPGLAQASQYGYDRGHHNPYQGHHYRHDSHRYCPPGRHIYHRGHFYNYNNHYYGRPHFRDYDHHPHRRHNSSGFSIYYSR